MRKRISIALTMLVSLPACTYTPPVTEKDEVSLETAGQQLACFMSSYRNGQSLYGVNAGTIVESAKVTLLLKASVGNRRELVVDAQPKVRGFSALGLTHTSGTESLSSRDNTIEVNLKNIYTASLNEPGKVLVGKQGPPLAHAATISAPVTEPCEPIVKPVPNEVFQRLNPQPTG